MLENNEVLSSGKIKQSEADQASSIRQFYLKFIRVFPFLKNCGKNTYHKIYGLNIFLSTQYSIVNCRHNAWQISRTYSS